MECKEHILYFMLAGKIKLSQYDYRFLSNLQLLITKEHITSNMATLFDKLLHKYGKQLNKLGHSKEILLQLPWKTIIKDSSIEHTSYRVSLIEDVLHIACPFNKRFIEEFRKILYNPYVWNKDSKSYQARFSTYTLRIATQAHEKFFTNVSYSDNLKKLISDINNYNGNYDPTLVKVKDKHYVSAINETLYEKLKNIELNDDIETYYYISKLGIKLDFAIDSFDQKFAGEYITYVDYTNLENAILILKKLNINKVFLTTQISVNTELRAVFTKHDMQIMQKRIRETTNVAYVQTHSILPEFISSGTSTIDKIIILRNFDITYTGAI